MLNSFNGYYYGPFNTTGFVHCGDTLTLALEKRQFLYNFNYTLEPQRVENELIQYAVLEWNDKSKLQQLRNDLSKRNYKKLQQ